MSDKLYKITLQGLQSTKPQMNISYVIAEDPTSAYDMVREFLDDEDYGHVEDRGLQTIELVAENSNYPNCGVKLFKKGWM